MRIKVKVKKLKENAILPSYAHEGDAAMDLFSFIVESVLLVKVEICSFISLAAFAVCLERSLTSLASTVKPLPASPAELASIFALRANRLV